MKINDVFNKGKYMKSQLYLILILFFIGSKADTVYASEPFTIYCVDPNEKIGRSWVVWRHQFTIYPNDKKYYEWHSMHTGHGWINSDGWHDLDEMNDREIIFEYKDDDNNLYIDRSTGKLFKNKILGDNYGKFSRTYLCKKADFRKPPANKF